MVASRKLARTYAQKVSGRTLSMSFSADTSDFQLAWELDMGIALPTEVFAHQSLHYAGGMDVQVQPAGALSWTMISKNIIGFTPTPRARNGMKVVVTIKKAAAAAPAHASA